MSLSPMRVPDPSIHSDTDMSDRASSRDSAVTSGSSLQSTSPAFVQSWIETIHKLERLGNDLENYRTIKESIRRDYEDLGDHYLDCGDLSNAFENYSHARDYCTSGKHVIEMSLNLIKVSIRLKKWSDVLHYVSEAEGTPDFSKGKMFFLIVHCLSVAIFKNVI